MRSWEVAEIGILQNIQVIAFPMSSNIDGAAKPQIIREQKH